jgi:predicted DNA-binding transcriptional regulator AlpA
MPLGPFLLAGTQLMQLVSGCTTWIDTKLTEIKVPQNILHLSSRSIAWLAS